MRGETLTRKRLVILIGAMGLLNALLGIRIGDLTLLQGASLTARGVRQWTREGVVTAQRGKIQDTNGDTLALSATAYIVTVNPRQVEDATLRKEPDFDKIGELSRELETVLEQIKAQPLYQALQKSRKAFSDMMAQVNAELSSVLNPGGSQGGCSGNCSACSGCS